MSGKLAKDLATITVKVEKILADVPAARDCDDTLLAEYLRKHTGLGSCLFVTLEDLQNSNVAVIANSVSRARRKIQQQGKFCGTRMATRAAEAKGVNSWVNN